MTLTAESFYCSEPILANSIQKKLASIGISYKDFFNTKYLEAIQMIDSCAFGESYELALQLQIAILFEQFLVSSLSADSLVNTDKEIVRRSVAGQYDVTYASTSTKISDATSAIAQSSYAARLEALKKQVGYSFMVV